MKKIVSILLTLVMVLSLIGTFAVFTSAANDLAKSYDSAVNGELLYEVKFGQTEGVYQSAFFSASADPVTATTVTTANGGKTLKINHSVDNAKAFYGGKFDGLTLGEGKQYTITLQVKIPQKQDKSLGIMFNFPESFADESLLVDKRPETKTLLGYYGTPDLKQTLAINGSSKRIGRYICDGQAYVTKSEYLFTANATGFYDFAIEVDGYYYTVYINNTLFDTGFFDEQFETPNLGLSFFCLHDAQFEIKNANVYNGLTKKPNASMPSYIDGSILNNHLLNPSTPSDSNKLLKTYEEAANGDLLYKVKFNATEGIFTPATILDTGIWNGEDPILSVQTTEDSATFLRVGSYDQTRTIWGDSIDGLKVSADTTYTLTYKFKAENPVNMGVGFLTNVNDPINTSHNFYGLLDYATTAPTKFPEMNIQHGYVSVVGDLLETKSRTSFYPVQDADGFSTVVLIVEGYKYNLYYWGECDNGTPEDFDDDYTGWVLFETYDTSACTCSTCSHHVIESTNLSFIAITWNPNLNLTVKDACIYKGVAVDLDEGKPAPSETTPSESETQAPESETGTPATQAPATQAPATQAPATEAPKAEGGCGGVIGGGLAVIAIISLGGVMIAKKRD